MNKIDMTVDEALLLADEAHTGFSGHLQALQILAAEVRRQHGEIEAFCMAYRTKCDDETKALHLQIDALRKDTERYQWLRDPNNMRAREIFMHYGDVDATQLDNAIDAELSKQETPT